MHKSAGCQPTKEVKVLIPEILSSTRKPKAAKMTSTIPIATIITYVEYDDKYCYVHTLLHTRVEAWCILGESPTACQFSRPPWSGSSSHRRRHRYRHHPWYYEGFHGHTMFPEYPFPAAAPSGFGNASAPGTWSTHKYAHVPYVPIDIPLCTWGARDHNSGGRNSNRSSRRQFRNPRGRYPPVGKLDLPPLADLTPNSLKNKSF